MPIAFPDVLTELAAILVITALLGFIVVRLKQPLLLGFIIAGILVGSSGLNWVRSAGQVHILAEIGLTMLLFVVGLRLDLHLIRSVGPVAAIVGLTQVVLTAAGGYGIAYLLGAGALPALYIAVALAFSSTIIVVKLLSDKREIDALHGRIALGILIVQDLLIVLAMIALSTLPTGGTTGSALTILTVIGKGLALLLGVGLASFFVLPKLLDRLAQSIELLMIFAISWALALATLSGALGFSKEVGAFIAGVALASTQYRDALGARLVSLRDFLLLFFFLELGAKLNLGALGSAALLTIPLSIFVLIGKPVVILGLMGLLGYRKRTSFLTAVSLAQISEFSFILAAMGASVGHIGQGTVGLITLTGLITIGLSTFAITNTQPLYERLSPYLRLFERRSNGKKEPGSNVALNHHDVLIFGLGRYGSIIAQELRARGRNVLGVDFDPQAVKAWNERNLPAIYGDAEDHEYLLSLPLATTRWVVSSVRDISVTRVLASGLQQAGYSGNVAFTAIDQSEAASLTELGADLVFMPFEDAAVQAVDLVVMKEDEITRKNMDKQIEAMTGHYVICGYGRMGQQIVKDLQQANVPHVVVESNPDQLPRLKEHNVPHLFGKASEDETLLKAGIKRAKGLISVAPTDEDNVFIVLTARVLNPHLFIVARSILEVNEDKLRRAGADRVMSPYILGGHRMAAAVIKPEVTDFIDLVISDDQSNIDVGHTIVPQGSPVVGKTLLNLGLWQNCGVTILAIRRDGVIHANPRPEHVIQAGDEIIFMGSQESITAASECIAK